jgi:hypothetical protein
MVKTIFTIIGGCIIAGILGLFIFFAVSSKRYTCCGNGGTLDNATDELPSCCAPTTIN